MSAPNRKKRIVGCCKSFNQHINRYCKDHGWNCPDNIIRLYVSPGFNVDFGMAHPDNLSFYKINYCPWCGAAIGEFARRSLLKNYKPVKKSP